MSFETKLTIDQIFKSSTWSNDLIGLQVVRLREAVMLREQVSSFRSQVLMGRYSNALALGKSIISQLQSFESLEISGASAFKNAIQQQYQKCLLIHNLIRGNQATSQIKSIAKWAQKQKLPLQSHQTGPSETGRWKKKDKMEEKSLKSQQPQEIQLMRSQDSVSQEQQAMLEGLEREVFLPLRMPHLFKNKVKKWRVIHVPARCLSNIYGYLTINNWFCCQYEELMSCSDWTSRLKSVSQSKGLVVIWAQSGTSQQREEQMAKFAGGAQLQAAIVLVKPAQGQIFYIA